MEIGDARALIKGAGGGRSRSTESDKSRDLKSRLGEKRKSDGAGHVKQIQNIIDDRRSVDSPEPVSSKRPRMTGMAADAEAGERRPAKARLHSGGETDRPAVRATPSEIVKRKVPNMLTKVREINIDGRVQKELRRFGNLLQLAILGTRGAVLHASTEMVLCFRNHILFPCFLKVLAARKENLPKV